MRFHEPFPFSIKKISHTRHKIEWQTYVNGFSHNATDINILKKWSKKENIKKQNKNKKQECKSMNVDGKNAVANSRSLHIYTHN